MEINNKIKRISKEKQIELNKSLIIKNFKNKIKEILRNSKLENVLKLNLIYDIVRK